MSSAPDSDLTSRTSKALWIPVIWLFIAGSRPISGWLNVGAVADTTDKYLEGSPIDRNIFTALILAAIIVLVLRGPQVGRLLRANWPLILFLLYCGLSIVWSGFRDVAFKRWIRAVGDIAMVSVVLTDPKPFNAVKKFLWRTGSVIFPLSILFDLGRGLTGRGWHYGLTLNKNMYGLISMILGVGVAWQFLMILHDRERAGRRKQLFVYGSIVAMAMWCLWSANSATSAACFLLGTILIMVMKRWRVAQKPAFVHLFVASVVFLAVYASLLNPNLGIISAMGKDPTLTGRTDLWPSLIAMTPSPWFGAGFESFWLGSRLTSLWHTFVWRPNEAHNGYIEIYLNLGWVGLILFGIVLVTGYRRAVKTFRQSGDIGRLSLAYFVVAIVYNLTEAGFRIFSPAWIVFLLSIIAASRSWREHESTKPADVMHRPYEISGLRYHRSDSFA